MISSRSGEPATEPDTAAETGPATGPHSGPDAQAVTATGHGRRWDLAAALGGVLLLVAAAVAGTAVQRADGSLHVDWPPLVGFWMPHTGPGTPAALTVAVAVVVYGPGLAARVGWRRLLWGAWGAAAAWTWSLALIDGWQRGVAERLTNRHEYLRVIDRFDDIGAALRGYTGHILLDSPDNWPAHVAGHPPAAVLTFVGLDRAGLGGGGWAGAFCITAGASAAAAVMVTLKALGSERAARTAAPFLVLLPAAVWAGASADGYFAAVAAWAVALLALAATRSARWPAPAALASGLLFGWTFHLSYGLTLMVIPAAAVLLLTRTARPLVPAFSGVAAVAGAFTAAGFNWWEGYDLLVERYYQGVARERPYWYWIWANLANAATAAGPAAVAGLCRAQAAAPRAVRDRWRARDGGGARVTAAVRGTVVMVTAVLLALLVADLSGMSKAETERIWLPFFVWLPAAAALLPAGDRRGWLAAQAAVALTLNHLVLTGW